MLTPISSGIILGNRYHLVRQLGHGGFGRTYLVEDQNRFNELCVLKEFAPQSNNPTILQKSQQLFEREASVLYQLKHPQIPQFRESFRQTINQQVYLFFVQEYIEGETYRTLLEKRKLHGMRFTEAECIDLMLKTLPVLQYIHNLGVIHRDISPDNLIFRHQDGLPILIDFGGVKQVAITIASEYGNGGALTATRLGKMGYAPDEQMQLGKVSPRSDLYSLAATILVLLTGKEPQDLIDPYTLKWNWSQDCSLSPQFATILNKMLSHLPDERYPSASNVWEILKTIPGESTVRISLTQPPPEFPENGQGIPTNNYQKQPPLSSGNLTPPPRHTQFSNKLLIGVIKTVLVIATILITANIGWWIGKYWLNLSVILQQNSGNGWQNRLEKLQIDKTFYVNLVDDLFYRQYPDLQGRKLTEDPSDQPWREKWHRLGNELLDKLENLSEESRKKLGYYDHAMLTQWKGEVNQLYLSSQALYKLADGKFFYWFPQISPDENLLDQPLGQVWQAITEDQLKLLQKGRNIQEISLDNTRLTQRVNDSLKPGEGKAYIVYLNKGLNLEVKLQPNSPGTKLTIYSPESPQKVRSLLDNSHDTYWSGKLEDSGYYQMVIVSDTSQPLSYELNLTISN